MSWFGRSDDDYQQEIREHIELETQANIDRGMSPDEARRAARVTFGSVSGVRELLHEGHRGYWWSTLRQDFLYGLRMIHRKPLLSCVVVVTLSLGLGVVGSVFSLANWYAFAPQVKTAPASFVEFRTYDDGRNDQTATVPRYERLVKETRSLRELAAWSILPLYGQLGAVDAERVQGVAVSCNYFEVFIEGPPVLGRFFRQDDCDSSQPVALLSEYIWRTRFSSDPEIVGKALDWGGKALTIVGVVVPPQAPDEESDIWVPYTSPSLKNLMRGFPAEFLTGGKFSWLAMAGRLQPGVSRRTAQEEFRVLLGRENHDDGGNHALRVTDGSLWSASPTNALWMFSFALAFPTIGLVVVCVTVATLLLSRAVGRQREMAVRLALGASKLRLVRLLLAESLLLSCLAAFLSLVFVYELPGMILGFMSATPIPSSLPIRPDGRVFAYLGAVTLFTAFCAGISPALESLNLQLGETLKGRRVWGRYRGPSRLRNLLVAAQVGLSMVPLAAAVLLARYELKFSDPGFEARSLAYFEVPESLKGNGSQSALLDAVRATPGVRSAAHADAVPLEFEGGGLAFTPPGQFRQNTLSTFVSPEYFKTLGIPIVSGRSFEARDANNKSGTLPVIVSQQFVRRFFPNQNPLGKSFEGGNDVKDPKRYEVIGIAHDRLAGRGAIGNTVNDGTFVYQLAEPLAREYVLIRFDGDPKGIIRTLQSAARQSTGLIVSINILRDVLDSRNSGIEKFQRILWLLCAAVVALSLIGVFGVLSVSITQRENEFAIRRALGALPADIVRIVLFSGFRPIPIGIVLGTGLSIGALKIAESQGVAPLRMFSGDPVPYLAAAGVLLGTTLTVMLSPAYRATTSDPMRALREE